MQVIVQVSPQKLLLYLRYCMYGTILFTTNEWKDNEGMRTINARNLPLITTNKKKKQSTVTKAHKIHPCSPTFQPASCNT